MVLFRAPFWREHRHLSLTKAGHYAVAVAFDGSDRADESAAHQSDHCRAVSRSANRRESRERDWREGRGVFAVSGRPARDGQLREVDRHPRLAAGGGAEMKNAFIGRASLRRAEEPSLFDSSAEHRPIERGKFYV